MSEPGDCKLKSLHDAVESKDLDLLESLLKKDVDPNAVDDQGMTALNKICETVRLQDVHVTMVRALLRHKADVNIESHDDMSPLVNLFQGGNNHRLRLEIFKLLLENGANVNRVDSDRDTILHLILRSDAWRPNLMEVVELLMVKCRIDVNAKNVNGHTPLHVAVGHCIETKAIELLLKNGANPNIVDLRGMAPINTICNEPELSAVHVQIVQLLVRHKADLDIRHDEGYTPMMDLLRSTESHKWRLQIFKLLVDGGANAKLAQKRKLNTIAHFVFHTYAKSPNIVPTAKQLLQSNVDLNARNKKGWTALHFAVTRCENLEAIELLLKNEANPNVFDNHKRTPLHWIGRRRTSLENGKFTGHHLKMIELLVEHGADLRLRDDELNSPIVELFLGARDKESRSKLFKLFLENDPDSKDLPKYSRMLLHNIFDASHEFASIEREAEFLIKYAGNVNQEDKKGRLLLHDAVNMLKADHVEFLFRNGADANVHDDNGCIALNYCTTLWDVDEIEVRNLEKFLKILRLNAQNGANLSHWDHEGKTVLHQLIEEFSLYSLTHPEEGHLATVSRYVHRYIEILLENGLNVDVRDRQRRTPLDVAVSHCNYQTVNLLVEHGADLAAVRFRGGFLEHEVPEALNLTTTQNILAIIELWQSKGVQINKQQYLTLFKFLTLHQDFQIYDVRFVDMIKFWKDNFFTGTSVALCNYSYWSDIYDYGSGSVIRKFVGTMIRALDARLRGNGLITHMQLILFLTIELHLYLAEYGNMYMDTETRNYLRDMCNLLIPDTPENRELHRPMRNALHAMIERQVNLAKEMIISNNISYLDLCTCNHDKTYSLLQKCDYESAIKSANFRNNFDDIGKIGGIIRGYITKALVRRSMKKVASKSLQTLSKGIIPDLCCEKIIEFLDNTDLVSVYEASAS
uniref:Uncharacterized protein n=1 Tax=Trichogramma kaykai TaxID=54128 RepID=A0ABD2XG76_9HYME